MSNLSKKGTVLVIASGTDTIILKDGTAAETGFFLNELAVPVSAVLKAGYDVILATPKGNIPVVDAKSLDVTHFDNKEQEYQKALDFIHNHPAVQNPVSFREAIDSGLDRFAGVFVPGGHPPMVDLMQDAELGEIFRHFHSTAKPTALLCHGPVAITAAVNNPAQYREALITGDNNTAKKLAEGWIYEGYRMTVISNEEEYFAEEHLLGNRKVPFYVANALSIAGGLLEKSANGIFTPHVVQDRELITGQNPPSDKGLAELFVKALDLGV
ncbi:MAG: type 1 glutamine amidotransferase domain-containing protein [Pedobacter sp.]|uniref:type 1 glutamine amidotransferase domain-containing protein n=1 Tax=Pedobacter sp. TaxID=1411316 RepID=UPI00339204BE